MAFINEISLLPIVRRHLEAATRVSLLVNGDPAVDFLEPKGVPALLLHDSISWRVFKNPLALFVGGIAAVLLELADPKVRTGVWEHSKFRTQPIIRMRRTGLAALTTVYAANIVSTKIISRVVRIHDGITGVTPAGQGYRANEPDLLAWVHATAAFSVFEAYSQYVCPLSRRHFDLFCAESVPIAELFGAKSVPTSAIEMTALFESRRDDLVPSPIVQEFLEIMRTAPLLPVLFRPFQRVLVRAAVDILPGWVRQRLRLNDVWNLRPGEGALVSLVGALADRILIRSNPAVLACVRLGLPENYLYQPAVMDADS